ncbi:MAG: class I SAM-dependent methyltransferase [Lentilitoribacter sp.]|uniref:class I SAM-dependent DNA methyltransferase n=1 Tax=Tateyamaria sp. TaxID=1929288 RepID=UPI003275CD68
MSEELSANIAYTLKTPEDSVRLYRKWAETYDETFAKATDYVLHLEVARHYVLMGGFGPVLDVGAGTGLCGEALRERGIGPVDGTDISPDMLKVAAGKGAYRNLFKGDLLAGLTLPEGLYQGAVSSGTFTHGHVGPQGIDTVLDSVRPGGWIVLAVNARHYGAAGFAAKIDELQARIIDFSETKVPIYGPASTGPNAGDTSLLLTFRKV